MQNNTIDILAYIDTMEANKAAGREPAKSTLVATAWISAAVCWRYGQGVILVRLILVGLILVGLNLVGLIIHIYYLRIARWVSQTRELTLGISLVVCGGRVTRSQREDSPRTWEESL